MATMNGFDHILNWKLKEGSHLFPGKDGGTCINEAAIVAAGFPYQPVRKVDEMPQCFSRPICRLAMILNDNANGGNAADRHQEHISARDLQVLKAQKVVHAGPGKGMQLAISAHQRRMKAGRFTMNVQAFQELKRVLAGIPEQEFNVGNWKSCACGHATRDEWFQTRGFTSCYDFGSAATFFGITHADAKALFSGQPGCLIKPRDVIVHIEAFLAIRKAETRPAEVARHGRRQAIIDGLHASAVQAAQKARRVVTALVGVFF